MTTTSPPTSAADAAVATPTDSELGRHLLTVRGLHFVMGALGDPYARLLCGPDDGRDDGARLGEQLRDHGKLHRSELGTYVTADADLARELLADPRLEAAHPGGGASHVHEDLWQTWRICHVTPTDGLLTQPRATYRRLGDLAHALLAPDRLAAAVGTAVAAAVDAAFGGPAGDVDLVADVLRPAVADAFARAVGLAAGPRAQVLEDAWAYGVALDAGLCPQRLPVARRTAAALARTAGLVETAVENAAHAGPGAPGPGLVGALLASGADPADAALAARLVLTVGTPLVLATATNAVLAVLDGGAWARGAADPALVAGAVAETLRWAPPVRLHSRTTQEPCLLAGQALDADAHVVLVVDAALRDPWAGPDPDAFDPARPALAGIADLVLPPDTALALPAPLVGPAAEAALAAVLARAPRLRRAGDVLRRMRSPVVRDVVALPVTR